MEIAAVKPQVFSFNVGDPVWYDGNHAIVQSNLDLDLVRIKLDSGIFKEVAINLLSGQPPVPTSEAVGSPGQNWDKVDDWRLEEAQRRAEILKPILESSTREQVEEAAKKVPCSPATMYRWLKFFRDEDNDITETISFLLPAKPTGGKKERFHEVIEKHIQDGIDSYLTPARLPKPKIIETVQFKCRQEMKGIITKKPDSKAFIRVPSANTIRNRIRQYELEYPELVAEKRFGKSAGLKHKRHKGAFPGAELPLQVVQIDHTPLNVMLVDDETGKPIGRAFLTAALDVYSRAVTGYNISLEPVGGLAVGVCVANSILPKESWLAEREISAKWPIWGPPAVIHVDNAMEFRSPGFARACAAYGIAIEWRPLGTPHYGGHIESFMKTVAKAMEGLPGTTFPIKVKGETKSEKFACFTFDQLELWFANWLCGKYHNAVHSGIGMTPLAKYREGTLNAPGRLGIPPRLEDEERVRIDFLPKFETTIQKYGIRFNGYSYSGRVLDPFICKKDAATGKGVKHFIRYDPRKMNNVYFQHPTTGTYFRIPRRYPGKGREHSLWEIKAAREVLSKAGKATADERLLDETLEKMHKIEAKAVAGSSKARKNTQKGKQNAKTPTLLAGQNTDAPPVNNPLVTSGEKPRPFVGITLKWGA